MQWKRVTRLGTMSGALALSACMMPYGGGPYEAPPPPVYSADESPDAYSYIDRADSLWEVIGNAPPDYAFSFEDAEPWAWELQDGDSIIVEETPDGIQSYYFGPEGEGPFLAVRPGMSFGFSGETVAVVYGPDGGALPREEGAANLEEGVALYARGRQLRRAMQQRQWREVDSQAWIDTSPLIWSSIQIWGEGRSRHSGWRRHHEQWRDADWRRRSEAEQLRRRALAEQFRRWREGGFQGPPPGRFHRPGEHGPGAGRPGRPGEPGTRPPRQPGQWGRPGRPWAGRPGAGQATPTIPRGPRRPNKPGVDDPESPVTDTPQTAPTPVPGAGVQRRPGWGGRPRPDRGQRWPEGSARPVPEGATPRPPRVEGERRGWGWRRPDAGAATPGAPAPTEGATPRPPRPEGGRGWGWRRPDAGTPGTPAPNRSRPADTPRPVRSAPPRSSEPRAAPPAPRVSPPPAPRPAPSSGPKGRPSRVESDN
nr:hypothetical protein [uncultured Sphingomonas sp.]